MLRDAHAGAIRPLPMLFRMATELDEALAATSLSEVERRVVERLVGQLREELGDELYAVWLYGSRARGEPPRPESDVDLLVISRQDEHRHWRRVHEIAYKAAVAEGASPAWYSVHVDDLDWLRGRREIRSFFIQEVDRDKVVLYGSPE